jgi:mannose-1-phosphate guanylyltransferase/mannose-1-phosphate guanylyltransferase/mannose-6-phosphate isomerase
MKKTVIPVILCGGSGTRLWPASREKKPKQFLALMNDLSLLQNTLLRAIKVAGCDPAHLVTVTLGAFADDVAEQLAAVDPGAAKHILREPAARDTAAAVAFAAAYVENTFGPDTVMWVLPADHHIGDEEALAYAFREAYQAACDGHLVTFGIRPTRPETGYGYIRLGDAKKADLVYKASAFVEKPNLETAQTYLDAGNYLWNSGMFLFETGALLTEYARHAAVIMEQVKAAMESADSPRAACPDQYLGVVKTPFDKAIMERSAHVAVVPCDPAWSDIGSWESLWEIRHKDTDGNVLHGNAAAQNARNCLIQSDTHFVAVAGLEDVVVIGTGDALLVTRRSGSDDLKALVQTLKTEGRPEVMLPPAAREHRQIAVEAAPPGHHNSVREIEVSSQGTVGIEAHNHALCFLTVTHGQALVMIAGESKRLRQHETFFIPQNTPCSIGNDGAEPLYLLEVSQSSAEVIRLGKGLRVA